MDDDELFKEATQGVKPIRNTGKVLHRKPATDHASKALLRENAQAAPQPESIEVKPESYVSDEYLEMLKPQDVLSFKRPGIQDGVFRKLRLGKYPIDGRLDLHRKTVVQARAELLAFITEAMQVDARTVLILHGKGERNVQRQAVLKSYTAKWLAELDEVMAFHSAQQKHGGLGAVYVLLKKSDRLKAENRERHGTRA